MIVIRERISVEESKVTTEGSFVTTDSYGFEKELQELIAKYAI